MSTQPPEFRRSAVEPITCLREGWRLIREQYWLFLGITVVGMLLANAVPLGIVLGPMMCGIYLCFFGRLRGEPVRFEMLFKGFDSFRESLIAALIQVVPVFVLVMLVQMIFFIGMVSTSLAAQRTGGAPPTPAALLGTFGIMMAVFVFVLTPLVLLFAAFFTFTFPLIVDRKLSGVSAVKLSFRAVAGNLGGVMGLLLLQMLLGLFGALLCYVGAVLFIPIGLASWAIAYQQVFNRGPVPEYT